MSHIEAYIDFGEEENIETETFKVCNSDLIDLSNKIQKHLLDDRKGEILRNGIKSIILGEPNVGKSSLLNHLVNRNAAIVTSIPGTTRDIVELTANIAGYPILLADTAGINRNTTDIIEKEGIKRAKDQAKMADFIMLVIDASKYKASNQTFKEYLSNYVKSLELECLLLEKNNLVNNCIIILNKIDLLNEVDRKNVQKQNVISISCANEEGFEKLLEKMSEKFEAICGNPTAENPTIEKNYDVVLAAQEIRKAARELGKITGHVSTEEILDIIFKNFCIGK
uniref:TrmE-type G domain-containing protein n=1 Tax=Trichogramma kaykai TaxID=54128 RepID=A0ABD2X8I0_9HYME